MEGCKNNNENEITKEPTTNNDASSLNAAAADWMSKCDASS